MDNQLANWNIFQEKKKTALELNVLLAFSIKFQFIILAVKNSSKNRKIIKKIDNYFT